MEFIPVMNNLPRHTKLFETVAGKQPQCHLYCDTPSQRFLSFGIKNGEDRRTPAFADTVTLTAIGSGT